MRRILMCISLAVGPAMSLLLSTAVAQTDFTLLTITNPTPANYPVNSDSFGNSVATVGERLLIGAPGAVVGETNSGAVYLFSINGELLFTFTNPTPAAKDGFGRSVAVMGTDRVLVGASSDDTGAIDTGAAYLFSIDGMLLNTFTNPTPESGEWFGHSVAALGTDHVLISAPHDNTGMIVTGFTFLGQSMS